jgi:hypothetical protein
MTAALAISEDRLPIHVTIAYASRAVALAAQRRIGQAADASAVPVDVAWRSLLFGAPCDVLVVCPYITDAERGMLKSAARGVPRPPVIVTLNDALGGGRATVEDLEDDPERLRAAGRVLELLEP